MEVYDFMITLLNLKKIKLSRCETEISFKI